MSTKKIGVSDITSSESKLKRFTLLCRIVRSERGLNVKKLTRLAKEKIGTPFKNPNVSARHIAILQKINLIENLQGVYVLTGDGKALCELANDSIDTQTQTLTFGERVIFLKNMFSSVLRRQLVELLSTVQQSGDGSKKKIINSFFSTQLAMNIWNRITVERNLTKLRESGKIPTFFENKFTCMLNWLEDIKLIQRTDKKIETSESGRTLLNELNVSDLSRKNMSKTLAKVLIGETSLLNYSEHKEIFLETFREAYSHFKIDSNVSDIRAIQIFVYVDLLKRGILMEDATFATMINRLSLDGIIRSVMLGRDGKPAYLALTST
jgi:hypothetical protein